MITVCPSCYRQFRIYARQLSAAKGQVQCGFCGEHFDALERLHDQPPKRSEPSVQIKTVKESEDQQPPKFEIPGIAGAEKNLSTGTGWSASADSVMAVAPATDNIPESPVNRPERQSYDESEDLAVSLLEPVAVQASRTGSLLWFLGIGLLGLTILLQFAWFNRDTLLSRYPRYLPYAEQLCDYLQCELAREQNLPPVVLVNRDVRDHPRYDNVLLVNATIENQSDQVRPYPDIQLSLFDTDGRITGYRLFRPAEYIEGSIDIEGGMRPYQPVHLVLEVTGSTDNAVSFEFGFF